MYLLYLDDSGTIGDPSCKHCIFAGFSLFETKTHWVEQDLEAIAQKYNLPPEIEFHGNPMRTGKGFWRKVPKVDREQAMLDVLNIIPQRARSISVFAAIAKKSACSGIDISEHMFTQVASRFDMMLGRLYQSQNKKERGLVIFDKNKSESRIQKMSHDFKSHGHKWGTLKNFAEVPLFLDSRASRLIQLADMVAYSLFRKYEANDNHFCSVFDKCYDAEGGIIHGLHELL
ncbi:MAG: DUF3800 domain-containing protein [Deltaproteobacteria bacterium]|jgi:hypothetical protein|nr:DUF3800 domain-containing protein [Deltaproteobacteria bacterium]